MLRTALKISLRPLSTMASSTPVEDALRSKITEFLTPTQLEIYNDSDLHSHHSAMTGSTSRETHFRVHITSKAFESKMLPARHRMVYALMKEELAKPDGIHALQLKTRTPAEAQEEIEREVEQTKK